MNIQWAVRGQSMDCPWDARGMPVGCSRAVWARGLPTGSLGCPWEAHGTPIGCSWNTYGIPMGRLWVVDGSPMVDHCFVPFCWGWAGHGLFVGCPWAAGGMAMVCPWDAHGLPMGYLWHGEQCDIHKKDKYCISPVISLFTCYIYGTWFW